METFTADYARQLVEKSKLKELGLILADIERVAETGATELVLSYKLKNNTEFELNKLGFTIENQEPHTFIRW
jgi:hypothetical protein